MDDLTLLTINQAAEILGVERTTIYRLIASGDLSVVDVGARTKTRGTPRIKATELEAFIAKRTTNARRHYRT